MSLPITSQVCVCERNYNNVSVCLKVHDNTLCVNWPVTDPMCLWMFFFPIGVSNLIQQVCRLSKGLRLLNLSKTSLSSKGVFGSNLSKGVTPSAG